MTDDNARSVIFDLAKLWWTSHEIKDPLELLRKYQVLGATAYRAIDTGPKKLSWKLNDDLSVTEITEDAGSR